MVKFKKKDFEFASEQWKSFRKYTGTKKILAINKLYNNLLQSITVIPFDWRFSSMAYINDTYSLLKETIYSYTSMLAAQRIYLKHVKEDGEARHVPFLMNYYASDALFRIPAVKDKLMMSYYCYFYYHDVEEPYETKNIKKRLIEQSKKKDANALKKPLRLFLKSFDSDWWKKVIKFRHMEAHRLDPKIEAYTIKGHHDWSYLKMISEQDALKNARHLFLTGYSLEDRNNMPSEIQFEQTKFYLKNQWFQGHYFEQVTPRSRLEEFRVIEPFFRVCINDLVRFSSELFKALPKTELFQSFK